MRQQILWAAGCLGFGLLLGGLMASLVRVDPNPPAPIEEIEAEIAALSPAQTGMDVAQSMAPDASSMSPGSAEPDADREWIELQAKQLVRRFMENSWAEFDTQWATHYAAEAGFLIDRANDNAWVTVTAARVPCERVDLLLRRSGDPELGQPDRCNRWLRAATEIMRQHGIEDKTPSEFLHELQADLSVRVMVVYAGWFKDPNANGEIQLVDARSAFMYPVAQFKQQNNEAQNAIFRAMQLGPYAQDSTQALPDLVPGP